MARQSSTPVAFSRTKRVDTTALMSSGRAGEVLLLGYIPILRGDSCSGRVGIDVDLAEMPKPLLNGVQANIQAWFVPKTAHPQFTGYEEFMNSYQGKVIKQLGAADRTPPPFFTALTSAQITTMANSAICKALGLHFNIDVPINTDLFDAFTLIYNFRLAAHSSRLARRKYAAENLTEAGTHPRAFWPSGRFSRVVPDYERALIVGSLDLDVAAGRIPVSGLGLGANATMGAGGSARETGGTGAQSVTYANQLGGGDLTSPLRMRVTGNAGNAATTRPDIWAEMANTTIGVTLADIDAARKTQSFAKVRASMAGNDATGFDNDDAIVAELMQGFSVPDDLLKRPWLLDSKRVAFGFSERHATDAANLDASVDAGASFRFPVDQPPRPRVGRFDHLHSRSDAGTS